MSHCQCQLYVGALVVVVVVKDNPRCHLLSDELFLSGVPDDSNDGLIFESSANPKVVNFLLPWRCSGLVGWAEQMEVTREKWLVVVVALGGIDGDHV